MQINSVSRRLFLKGAAGAGVLMGMGQGFAASAKPRFEMGLQLYTVRDPMARDPLATLKQIAALGYRNLETFGFDAERVGYYGMGAADFKRTLDDLNLRTTSGHYDLFKYLETPCRSSAITSADASRAPWCCNRNTSPGPGCRRSSGRSGTTNYWRSG